MDKEIKELILKEIKGSFDYFYYETNLDENVYGLVRDMLNSDVSSIAAIGFALTSYVVGVKHEFISFEEGYLRTLKTLQTVSRIIPRDHGFFTHFVNFKTGEKCPGSEYSTIDTAIFFLGAITAGVFFKKEVQEITNQLFNEVDFDYMIRIKDSKKQFLMALFDDNKDYSVTWDHYAEQLMLYILYAGQERTSSLTSRELYYGFLRDVGSYKGDNFIYCFNNSLFIHQFSHCYFDFKTYLDERGCDWFLNSRLATLANKEFALSHQELGYKDEAWGLSACYTPEGYKVYGAPPYGFLVDYESFIDGTIAPYASLSSINFTEAESLKCLKYFSSIQELNGKYGFYDCFNLSSKPWISKTYLGIDKGPTLVMLENYLNGGIWELFMESEIAKRAILKLHFQKHDYKNYEK